MVTSHERAWLKTMLNHPAAADAFAADTLAKLRSALEQDMPMDVSAHLIEKARSQDRQVYHPMLRPLRRSIMNRNGMRITYEVKGGRVISEQRGFPYKLEYSMVKREWYLLWYHIPNHAWMSTRLSKILSVTAEPLDPPEAERILKKIGRILESRRYEAVIEVVPKYNAELSRILYAFSCFEKNVIYDAEKDTYRIKITLLKDELEYLLSKIRFLGMRVRVVEGGYLKRRMLESATLALERYGVDADGGEGNVEDVEKRA
jgi:predicted DNA-binding transcriptional regulator YafY